MKAKTFFIITILVITAVFSVSFMNAAETNLEKKHSSRHAQIEEMFK